MDACELPLWVEYMKAFSTPLIAAVVALIAFRQWRTAHQNLLLALFDKRVAVIKELRGVVAEILQGGALKNGESVKFLRATSGADFLFGSEVTTYLDRIYTVLLDLHVADADLAAAEGEDRGDVVRKRRQLRNELDAFFRTFNALVAPYVQMHQKHRQL